MKIIYRLTILVIFFFITYFFGSLIFPLQRGVASAQSGAPTSTPSFSEAKPLVFADLTTNCREGPGTAYKIVGWLKEGNSTEVLGRDEGRHWWYVENPAREGNCWVWAHSTYTDGNMGSVPVVLPLSTPKQNEADQQCQLTLCFSGNNEVIYCGCKPVEKEPPKFICYNYGCPTYPWLR